MPDMNTNLPDGTTATSKDKRSRMVVRNGTWARDDGYRAPAGSAPAVNTSAQDRTALNEASSKAAAERDAQRTYEQVSQAVRDMGTGPVRARYLDAITPDQEGGVLDTIGAVLGTPLRALEKSRTFEARDHLNTVSANVALAGSQQMKGSSSDKDVALMRLSGLGPMKTEAENRRIIQDAQYRSGLSQVRALVTADWISKYGSLSAPSPNGMTFEEGLQLGERSYNERYESRKRGLPRVPPGKTKAARQAREERAARARGGREITIDINGNTIR